VTHTELMEKLQASLNDANWRGPHRALFAIANLHRPSDVNEYTCISCSKYGPDTSVVVGYPCLTLQCVEKGLD
jgi:hypothetical protein